MGYYSLMNANESIKTDYSLDEIRSKFEEYKNKFDSSTRIYLDIYDFYNDEGGIYLGLANNMDNDWIKHYETDKLAKFISTIIKEGSTFKLEFVGEDYTKWGYLITKGLVMNIRWIEVIEVDS